MSGSEPINEEHRRLFEKWGAAKVRRMVQSGHYDAELRRPMLAWIEEKNARLTRMRLALLIVGLVLFFVGLFIALLEGMALASQRSNAGHFASNADSRTAIRSVRSLP